jgi:hypothetical protein
VTPLTIFKLTHYCNSAPYNKLIAWSLIWVIYHAVSVTKVINPDTGIKLVYKNSAYFTFLELDNDTLFHILAVMPLWHNKGRFQTSELQDAQSSYRNVARLCCKCWTSSCNKCSKLLLFIDKYEQMLMSRSQLLNTLGWGYARAIL